MAIGAIRTVVTYEWRGRFQDFELNALHAEGFDHPLVNDAWNEQLERHSLGWVTARDGHELIGFANVAWDGGIHGILLDTLVALSARRRGIGTRLVDLAVAQARAAGCEWLHVDFEDEHRGFYVDACGFRLTGAGLLALR